MKKISGLLLILLLLCAAGSVSAQLHAGDTVTMGTWEQDNDPSNGPEPIEWIVLDTAEGRALVVSRYGLALEPYHNELKDITWENCQLRARLNGEFLDSMFSEEERSRILTTQLSNPDNPETGADGGNDTQDRLFLLSIDEVQRYFPDDTDRRCESSAEVKAQGAQVEDGFGWWWIRTPGGAAFQASLITSAGIVGTQGDFIMNGKMIRPAMWIEAETAAGPTSVPTLRGPMVYTVQEGESCEEIVERFALDQAWFLTINQLSACELTPGQQVMIPAETPAPTPTPTPRPAMVYTVEEGDSCEEIVTRFSLDRDWFLMVNQMTECVVTPGQQLFIPAEGARMPTATPTKTAFRVGDIITFGHYEQDNNRSNGAEPIEWQVLAVEPDRALVISRYALDAKPYNDKKVDITWENCTLRAWLNGRFYSSAFSEEEQSRIRLVTNKNPDNTKYGTYGGQVTQDRIFLLSIDEAQTYFTNEEARRCYATDYAKSNGALANVTYGTSWCWLRSPGYNSCFAGAVNHTGYVAMNGNIVTYDDAVVRPAFWLDL